jgi:ribosomal protein S18 acetylase RimI-like enzyme
MEFTIALYDKKKHASGWARTHTKSWREAYRDLMDPQAFSFMTVKASKTIAETKIVEGEEFVALVNNRVVGLAGFAPVSADEPDKAAILGLYVVGKWQNNGIGKALLETCLEKIGRKKTILYVLKGNAKAISFYEHLGFRLTGKTKTEIVAGVDINEYQMIRE